MTETRVYGEEQDTDQVCSVEKEANQKMNVFKNNYEKCDNAVATLFSL